MSYEIEITVGKIIDGMQHVFNVEYSPISGSDLIEIDNVYLARVILWDLHDQHGYECECNDARSIQWERREWLQKELKEAAQKDYRVQLESKRERAMEWRHTL